MGHVKGLKRWIAKKETNIPTRFKSAKQFHFKNVILITFFFVSDETQFHQFLFQQLVYMYVDVSKYFNRIHEIITLPHFTFLILKCCLQQVSYII